MRSIKAFFSAFVLTACLIMMAGGCYLADFNTRKMIYGADATKPAFAAAAKSAAEQIVSADPEHLSGPEGDVWQWLPVKLRAALWSVWEASAIFERWL